MRQFLATLTDRQSLHTHLQLLTLYAPDLPQLHAGQLILVRAGVRFDPYLRTAFFPISLAGSNDSCLLLADGRDVPSEHLYTIPAGSALDIIAPVGNGFTIEAGTQRLLLVCDEAHAAPLIALAREAAEKQIAVTLLIEADSEFSAASSLLPLDVEYQVVPSLAAALPTLLRWPDQICAAGDMALYALLKAQMAMAGLIAPARFAQVVITPPLACGFGACLACAVETPRGMRLACVDGPVFDLAELVLP
jgi:dihydroorotate dehydrogenase electron transfer subunit